LREDEKMKTFVVTLDVTREYSVDVEVEAASETEAYDKADAELAAGRLENDLEQQDEAITDYTIAEGYGRLDE